MVAYKQNMNALHLGTSKYLKKNFLRPNNSDIEKSRDGHNSLTVVEMPELFPVTFATFLPHYGLCTYESFLRRSLSLVILISKQVLNIIQIFFRKNSAREMIRNGI